MHAYVGIKYGSIRAIVLDDPKDTDLTAEMLADWVKMGRTVERMPLDEAIERASREKEKPRPIGQSASTSKEGK